MISYSLSVKRIRDNMFMPAYLLNGTETLLKEEWLLHLARHYLGENYAPEDIRRIEDGKTDLKKVMADINMPALFSGGRTIVIIDNPPYLPTPPKDKKKKNEADNKEKPEDAKRKAAEEERARDIFTAFWEREAAENAPGNIIVFRVRDADKRRRFFRMLNSDLKTVIDCSALKGDELNKWVMHRMKKRELQLEPKALEKLLLFTEGDLWRLDRELAKISDYMDGGCKVVDEEVVDRLVYSGPRGNIFNLVDALGEGSHKKAFSYLKALFFHREAPLMVLYMITRQYRLIIKAKSLKKEGIPSSKAASLLEAPPFVASKVYRQAENYHEEELREILKLLYETDLGIKTGAAGSDPELSMELLLARIASVAGTNL